VKNKTLQTVKDSFQTAATSTKTNLLGISWSDAKGLLIKMYCKPVKNVTVTQKVLNCITFVLKL
jgi:hypothetical protein